MKYLICCVESTAELIHSLCDSAEEIEFEEFAKNCEELQEWAISKGYEGLRTGDSEGLNLQDDWHVTYNRGLYDGESCYFLQWSGIEFIWTDSSNDSGGFGYGSRF